MWEFVGVESSIQLTDNKEVGSSVQPQELNLGTILKDLGSGIFPRAYRRDQAGQHLDFGLLIPRPENSI